MSAPSVVTLGVLAMAMAAIAATRAPVPGSRHRAQGELTQVAAERFETSVGSVPRQRVSRRVRRRRDEAVRAALAELCDVIGAAVRAGLNLPLALEVAEDLGPSVFTGALRSVRGRVDRGERLVVALGQLPDLLGDGVRPLTGLLQAAERDGIALARLIEALAADARRERRHHVERNARRLPVLLLGPLVGCILPAFMIFAIVPVVIASVLSLAA